MALYRKMHSFEQVFSACAIFIIVNPPILHGVIKRVRHAFFVTD